MSTIRINAPINARPIVTVEGQTMPYVSGIEFEMGRGREQRFVLTLCPEDVEIEGVTVVEKREHQWISERIFGDRDDHQRCVICGRSRTVKVECEAGE